MWKGVFRTRAPYCQICLSGYSYISCISILFFDLWTSLLPATHCLPRRLHQGFSEGSDQVASLSHLSFPSLAAGTGRCRCAAKTAGVWIACLAAHHLGEEKCRHLLESLNAPHPQVLMINMGLNGKHCVKWQIPSLKPHAGFGNKNKNGKSHNFPLGFKRS